MVAMRRLMAKLAAGEYLIQVNSHFLHVLLGYEAVLVAVQGLEGLPHPLLPLLFLLHLYSQPTLAPSTLLCCNLAYWSLVLVSANTC